MAIGAITRAEGVSSLRPTFIDRISFAGDAAYATGGTAGFQASVQGKTGTGRNIIAVISQDCGGYLAVYDHANDKLKVLMSDGNAGVLVEAANAANLSAVTFNLVVISN